jgi:hypothetical protein
MLPHRNLMRRKDTQNWPQKESLHEGIMIDLNEEKGNTTKGEQEMM